MIHSWSARACAALLALVAGCTSAGVAVTDSTRPVTPGQYEVLGKTTGSCWAGYFYVLSFIPIHFGELDPAGAARDDALAKFPGADAIVESVADRMIVFVPIPLLHVVLTITDVEGTAVRTVQGPPAPDTTAQPPEGGR